MPPKPVATSAKQNLQNRGSKHIVPSAKLKRVESIASPSGSRASSKLPCPSTHQRLLDIFSSSFANIFDDDLKNRIQTVKGHLYDRDFAKAFGEKEFLEAYAVRWSPTRALGYEQLLSTLLEDELRDMLGTDAETAGVEDELDRLELRTREQNVPSETKPRKGLRAFCIGGGAGAEVVAFAGAVSMCPARHSNQAVLEDDSGVQDQSSKANTTPLSTLLLVDIADWSHVTEKLLLGITTRPAVSKYASAEARAQANVLIRPDQIDVTFEQADILGLSMQRLTEMTRGCTIVTMLFTLNELYTTSMSKTTNLLLSLTTALSVGTVLLVVDSPGSYSTVQVGKDKHHVQEKKYPMHWLLDHTLLEAAKGDGKEPQWSKLHEEESKWFRLSQGLEYPLGLEDMRYQKHVYKRL